MSRSIACIAVVLSCLFICTAVADTIVAPSCSQDDVRDAIDAAEDGDTVLVPEGQSVWNYCMEIDPMPSIFLLGAGAGRTVIVNEVPRTGWKDTPLWITGIEPFRISGFTFKGGREGTGDSYQGTIRIDGTCKSWRIDHCEFDTLRARAVVTNGYTLGVIDHCAFIARYAPNILVSHDAWGGHSFGDGSWSDQLALGTEKAIYIESNSFVWDGVGHVFSCVDSNAGGRYVFRHNDVINSHVINHGTESGGRLRSCFSFEIYENTFDRQVSPGWWTVFHCRGGTGVMFNNTITGNYTSLCHVANYRDYHGFHSWGQCDGTSPYDLNDGAVYETGAHTGGNNETVLTCSGKQWQINEWFGYSLHNTTQEKSSAITSNTATTITYVLDQYADPMSWDTGDDFVILRAYPCLDQVGRSTGDLLYNFDPPLPMEWPRQASEPFCEWNNTINGFDKDIVSDSPHVLEGRDYLNDTERPGYAPYAFPHPLIPVGKSFVADAHEIPASTGASVGLVLVAGSTHAGRDYLLLGSASGTTPGTPLPGGTDTLPLNWDWFTKFVLTLLNSVVFSDFSGQLDSQGRAVASIHAPPLPSVLIGVEFYFAFCLTKPFDFASNPERIVITP